MAKEKARLASKMIPISRSHLIPDLRQKLLTNILRTLAPGVLSLENNEPILSRVYNALFDLPPQSWGPDTEFKIRMEEIMDEIPESLRAKITDADLSKLTKSTSDLRKILYKHATTGRGEVSEAELRKFVEPEKLAELVETAESTKTEEAPKAAASAKKASLASKLSSKAAKASKATKATKAAKAVKAKQEAPKPAAASQEATRTATLGPPSPASKPAAPATSSSKGTKASPASKTSKTPKVPKPPKVSDADEEIVEVLPDDEPVSPPKSAKKSTKLSISKSASKAALKAAPAAAAPTAGPAAAPTAAPTAAGPAAAAAAATEAAQAGETAAKAAAAAPQTAKLRAVLTTKLNSFRNQTAQLLHKLLPWTKKMPPEQALSSPQVHAALGVAAGSQTPTVMQALYDRATQAGGELAAAAKRWKGIATSIALIGGLAILRIERQHKERMQALEQQELMIRLNTPPGSDALTAQAIAMARAQAMGIPAPGFGTPPLGPFQNQLPNAYPLTPQAMQAMQALQGAYGAQAGAGPLAASALAPGEIVVGGGAR